ncbi:hypothetical protein DNTS_014407 [Danionella cerebrum]|uniref:Solute carrier family 2, facilitated glucose transporter member 5 n=1 Tax=Danionella cerebrum TaxID=2873325 RepID=A0A553MXI7_9TELE|nr:hypothetical protein DNTS_014407 [Danionella translucida]
MVLENSNVTLWSTSRHIEEVSGNTEVSSHHQPFLHWAIIADNQTRYKQFIKNQLTVPLLTSIVAAVLGSLQIGYQTGNINAPARVQAFSSSSALPLSPTCEPLTLDHTCNPPFLFTGIITSLVSLDPLLWLHHLDRALPDLVQTNSPFSLHPLFYQLTLAPAVRTKCAVPDDHYHNVIEEFFNSTWRSRHNQSIPDHSLTFLWSLSVSIKDFGALLGSLGVKGLADTFGRRNAILIANALSVIGASLMFMSKATSSFEVLIVGRLIFGLFCGLVMSLNPLYIQGVSPTNLRGAFATLNQVFFASGILLGMVVGLETVLGTEKSWCLMLSLSLIPATLQYLTLPFCPESPRYLFINRGKEKEAEVALSKLRGNPEMVLKEMEEMKEEAANSETGVTVREFLRKRRYRQPIILVLIINLGSQLSGFNAIINYSTKMFAQSNFEEAKYLTLGVGAVNVAFTIVAFFLVERAGRRKLLLAGFLCLALCNLLMTITYSILTIVPVIRIIQVLVVFLLISAYEVGPGPISWFIAAELFDQSARPIAMAFTSMLNWGGKFLLALLFPPLLKMCGAYVYLLFMCMALIAFTYTMFRLPETKGRTFDDIAAEFRGADSIPLHNKITFNTFA